MSHTPLTPALTILEFFPSSTATTKSLRWAASFPGNGGKRAKSSRSPKKTGRTKAELLHGQKEQLSPPSSPRLQFPGWGRSPFPPWVRLDLGIWGSPQEWLCQLLAPSTCPGPLLWDKADSPGSCKFSHWLWTEWVTCLTAFGLVPHSSAGKENKSVNKIF